MCSSDLQDMPNVDDIGGDKWQQVTEKVNDNYFFIDMDRYTLEDRKSVV